MALLRSSLATLAAFSASSPLLFGASAAPQNCSSSSPASCGRSSGGADVGEEGSLLQAHPFAAASGCPPARQWALLQQAARKMVGDAVQARLPLSWTHAFDAEPIGVGSCSATLTGSAEMTLDTLVKGPSGVRLSQLTCDHAVCASPKGRRCGDYAPLEMTIGFAADAINLRAVANIHVVWGAGCKQGPGSIDLHNADVGFTLTGSTLRGTSSVHFVVSPFNVSSFSLSTLTLSYESVTDLLCSVEGAPVPACLDAISILKSQEYKRLLQDMIDGLIGSLNGVLAGQSVGFPHKHQNHPHESFSVALSQ